ncbi:MAG: hypothetical protein HN849_10995, partial [Victivallales bacterium]|nr:hypothetical protein [Victivallales bacterium]
MSKDPGKTWIAPFTVDGSSQVLVNGTLLAPHKRIEKWGGTGQYVDVRPGFTRVEVLQMASGSGSYEAQGRGRRQRDSGGLMYLTWRTPNASMKELGGVRSKKVPMAGSSRMETRAVNNAEIVRSGRGKVVEAQYKDGLPVAVGTARPKHLFWFENTAPFFLYELDASRAGNPAGTTYTWQFDSRGTAITGESVQWLFPGRHEAQVKLVASSDARRSQATVPFYCYAPIKSDLNDPGTRKAFLDASLAMFTAAHRSVNPVEGCGSGYWSTLLQAVGIGEGVDLLSYLLSERPGLLTQNLPPDQIDRLREIVLDAVPRKGAAEAITWIRGQRNRTSNGRLLGRLTQAEVEVRMHYMGESNTVVRLLSPYYKQSGEMGELSRIRLGDLAFLSGDLNRATALYADVQNRVRHLRNTQERLPVGHQLGGGLARSAKELKAQREQSRAVRSSRQEDVRVDNWKLTAFLGVSVSETVKSLIDQNQLLKAHETLQAWERQFPLSKVSGDYV